MVYFRENNFLETDQGMTEDENEVFKQVGKSKNNSNQNRKELLKQANKKPVSVIAIQM
ncbi:hypothetical protein TEHD86_0185 [Tetragenococcus halophilus subsp. halophilus]|uniref:Uncharacterized protein n=1 Tax=Tetragenococcus halophilus subsp. halophilus TaxID=1513897 RepID=A0A2H6C2J5_TETHA|nr:hypothetical protein [Tetragenococcus halophilus]MCT8311241.1 hypothetical protein [Tetragenococcus halophilus]GBD59215.1 hypothetical protein TEHN0098T_1211 [Tetragenococcus halophilus subsp. halophilus]GBD69287.1 hypothetical protein TEHN7118_2093 [Tetragenococcus halophilus subsp. halophilus]GBD79721.1 hypothetical protein TEHD10_0784 [Tetragenococcus halophilus subsp. halophilus]GBD81463.1 hypothetical protein TEHD86_0185 [Tetragenococcus halophilus subsp. halophilus]